MLSKYQGAHPAVKTFIRAFIPAVLAAFLADGADIFAVSLSDLRAWLAIGIGAGGAVVLKAIDPSETEYGNGSGEDG